MYGFNNENFEESTDCKFKLATMKYVVKTQIKAQRTTIRVQLHEFKLKPTCLSDIRLVFQFS